jgi:hypothetical protein
MPTRPRLLTSFDDLSLELGDRFVLFCGSGVSGAIGFLPMVRDVLREFFGVARSLLSTRSRHYDQVVCRYAAEIEDGLYRPLLADTKFEDFILRVEGVVGLSARNALLRALFLCREHQFNENHAAISSLLENARISTCITTNFDNAIERAGSLGLKRFIGYDLPSDTLPENRGLLKLHGDVETEKYITNIEDLYTGFRQRKFEPLTRLLSHQTVLVAGYSGRGDIDIAPHLVAAAKAPGAKFIWLTAPWQTSSDVPLAASYLVKSDLFSTDPSNNWLLRLGSSRRPRSPGGTSGPDWTANLETWFRDRNGEEINDLIATFIGSRSGWAQLHLQMVREWSGLMTPATDHLQGRAFFAVSDYLSAMQRFEAPVPPEDQARVMIWKGFCYWRMGQEEDALRILEPIATRASPSHELCSLFCACRRHYIEVCRDQLRRITESDERRRYYERRHVDQVRRLFEAEEEETSTEDVLLTKIVLVDLERVMGRSDDAVRDEATQLVELAAGLFCPVATRSAVALLLSVSLRHGVLAWLRSGEYKRFYNLQSWRKFLAWSASSAFRSNRLKAVVLDCLDGSGILGDASKVMHVVTAWRIRRWRRAMNDNEPICVAPFVNRLVHLARRLRRKERAR